jgi:prepilin-type N-terminal cleavage/methylation domain-containing protein
MLTNLRRLKTNKGMTLVEVIISVALIGIISMMMVSVMSTGALLALKSGDNTKVTGNASGVIENVLGGSIVTQDGSDLKVEGNVVGTGIYAEDDTVEATVVFNGGVLSDTMKGTFYMVDSSSDRNDTSMKVFVPEE